MSAARKADSSGSSVSSDSSTPEEGIHKCDTVPPPEGEADAYNAPTRIGPMARGVVEQLMAQADAMTGHDTPPKSGERSLAARTPQPSAPPFVVMPARSPAPVTIPQMYDAADDGDQLDPTSIIDEGEPSRAPKLEVNAPPPVHVSSSRPIASQTLASQLDAYRSSVTPPRNSDAKLIFAVGLVVSLGLAALYCLFLAA